MQTNHYHVERQCIYARLSCVGFKTCALITNDLILRSMLNLVNLPHVHLDAANIANCLYWFNVSNDVLCFPGESRSNRWQPPFTSQIRLLLGLLHIIGGRRNGFEFLSYTSSSSWHSPYILYTSLSSWFYVFLSVSFLVMVHLTCFSDCKAIHIRQDVGQRTLIIILVRHFSDCPS